MRILVFTLLFALVPVVAQTQQPAQPTRSTASKDPATPEQIREYMALTDVVKMMKAQVSQAFSAMRSTAPRYIPAAVWEDMEKTFDDYDFSGALISLYQKHFTRTDLEAILAFYHTDAGKRLLADQPAMIAEAQTTFRAIGEKLGEAVGERHAAEIEAARKKYEQDIIDKQSINLNPDPK